MATNREHFAEHNAIKAKVDDGFPELEVATLTVTGSITSDGQEGLTGNYEGEITRVRIKNGIITGIELA